MLISALCDYYDELAKDGKLVPECYEEKEVHYLIALSPDGKIDDIIDWRITEQTTAKNGKIKEIKRPRTIILPLRTQKSTFDFNMVEHRPLYIFGLNFDKKEKIFSAEDRTNKAKNSHTLFRDESLRWIEGLDSPIIKAFRNFLQSWIPEQETENPFLKNIEKGYNNSYFAFCLSGRPDILLHEDSQIKEVWERYYFTEKVSDSKVMAQCAITGEKNQPIAKIHRKISGIPGGQKTLVCCKTSAGWSYGNEKSYNSNISEAVMKKYTAALDYLLKDRKHKQQIDDITVLFWAEGGEKNDECVDFLNMFLFGSDSETADKEETDRMLLSLMSKAREGRVSEETINAFENIDENVNFYIVGLKPNAYRISLKFIYRRRLGAMLSAVAAHQADMQIGGEFRNIPLWRLKNELKSPKSSKENIDTSLMTLLFKSIIYGTPYPNYLLSAVVTRIRTDRSINYVRAGTLKAFINRKARASGQKEEFKLALDKQNNNQAYLCGRLFSVLEHIQQSASSAKLNRTIKDAYFSSAASKPALVFPKLISLSQNHMKKLNEKNIVFYNKLIEEIIGKLNGEFPDTLMLTDQGRFMIGYYQQDEDFYKKQSDKSEEEK